MTVPNVAVPNQQVSKNQSKTSAGKSKRASGPAKKRRKRKKIVLPNPDPGAFDTMLTKVIDKKPTTNEDKDTPDSAPEEDLPEPEETPKKKPKIPKRKKVKAATEVEQSQPEELALDYLTTWHKNREKWSFKKVRQVWLLQHIYDRDKISADNFKILLDYLAGAKGSAKTKTIEDAEKLFADNSNTGELSVKLQRARDIIQHLQ